MQSIYKNFIFCVLGSKQDLRRRINPVAVLGISIHGHVSIGESGSDPCIIEPNWKNCWNVVKSNEVGITVRP